MNDKACPWDDVQLPDSPPVLPPLNMTLNDSDVHIKGGNVTISGVKIEGASGFSSGVPSNVSSSSSLNGSVSASNGSQALKPRICQFNGSLAFYTFGVVVDILGEFQLQRGMSWMWNTTWKAWVAEVSIRGTFSFTREEILNNVSVRLCRIDTCCTCWCCIGTCSVTYHMCDAPIESKGIVHGL
jgi:hypothetical protein